MKLPDDVHDPNADNPFSPARLLRKLSSSSCSMRIAYEPRRFGRVIGWDAGAVRRATSFDHPECTLMLVMPVSERDSAQNSA